MHSEVLESLKDAVIKGKRDEALNGVNPIGVD